MTLRAVAKAVTPPILRDLTRWMRGLPDPAQSDSMFRGDYASFDEAASHAIGYEDPNAGEAASKWLSETMTIPQPIEIDGRFQQVHSALCIAREKLGKHRIRVLDVGGSSGSYYFRLKDYFQPHALDWTVVETASMVRACAPIAAGQVSYMTEIPVGKNYDVAVVSGTLQCLPDAYDWLDRIMAATRWLIVTRLPVQNSPNDKFVVQTVPKHLYTGSMPVTLFSEVKIRAAIEARGRIEQSWSVPQDEGSLAYIRAKPVGYLIRVCD